MFSASMAGYWLDAIWSGTMLSSLPRSIPRSVPLCLAWPVFSSFPGTFLHYCWVVMLVLAPCPQYSSTSFLFSGFVLGHLVRALLVLVCTLRLFKTYWWVSLSNQNSTKYILHSITGVFLMKIFQGNGEQL